MAFWEAAFNGTYGNNYRLRLNVDVIAQEIQNNRSLIRYTAWWEKTGAGSTYNNNTTYGNTNINGYNPQRALGAYNMDVAGERMYLAQNEDYWIGHDGNGYANPYFGVNYDTGTVGSAGTGGNYTMPQFALYLGYNIVTIDQITSNSMQVRLQVNNGTMDTYAYSLNGGANWTNVGFTGTDVTFTITGLAAYTTYNLRFSVHKQDSARWTENGNYSRTTLGYAAITSQTQTSITDTAFTTALTTDVAVSEISYKINGGDWVVANTTNTSAFEFSNINLLSDADYTIQTRVKRADSGLYTESAVQTVRTLAQNKFFIADL